MSTTILHTCNICGDSITDLKNHTRIAILSSEARRVGQPETVQQICERCTDRLFWVLGLPRRRMEIDDVRAELNGLIVELRRASPSEAFAEQADLLWRRIRLEIKNVLGDAQDERAAFQRYGHLLNSIGANGVALETVNRRLRRIRRALNRILVHDDA